MPLAQFQVVSIDQLTATDGLASGTVDVAVAPLGGREPGVHGRPLYSDQAALVLRAGHPLDRTRGSRRSPGATVARLARAQFNALRHVDTYLVLGQPGVGHAAAEAFFRQHGLERQVALIVPSFSAAAMIAATTDLAASMPRRVADRYAQMLSLRLFRLPTPPLRFEMQLIWHERTHEDPGAVFFRDLIVSAVGQPRAGRATAA
jgi:DNA-binding transcriptional LysR family regulator